MPRPTAAQLAYGSATVVLSTVALLLLTRTTSGLAVAAIGVAAMMLGLLVAVALPMGRATRPAARTKGATAAGASAPAGVAAPSASAAPSDGLPLRPPAPRARAGAQVATGRISLRR
ncbi:hypothetical protein OHS70_23340 [Streptomyces sp. NBC_00390]|uniref:hypothetical protein n=1 Tax=Streptomyces sp. NBC_00390 TaxID=2975736 RepID=UPI002E246295